MAAAPPAACGFNKLSVDKLDVKGKRVLMRQVVDYRFNANLLIQKPVVYYFRQAVEPIGIPMS